jgi:hypothetical protein
MPLELRPAGRLRPRPPLPNHGQKRHRDGLVINLRPARLRREQLHAARKSRHRFAERIAFEHSISEPHMLVVRKFARIQHPRLERPQLTPCRRTTVFHEAPSTIR